MLYQIPKYRMAEMLLQTGETVVVHLSPKVAEVDVPDWLMGKDQIVLEIGRDMAVPIPDLHVSEQGFSGTLVFRGYPRYVFVPWTAVFGIYLKSTGRGGAWGEDIPESVKAELLAKARVGVTPPSHVPDHSGKVVDLAAFRARRQAKKDGVGV